MKMNANLISKLAKILTVTAVITSAFSAHARTDSKLEKSWKMDLQARLLNRKIVSGAIADTERECGEIHVEFTDNYHFRATVRCPDLKHERRIDTVIIVSGFYFTEGIWALPFVENVEVASDDIFGSKEKRIRDVEE
jgi:hypothetical protein